MASAKPEINLSQLRFPTSARGMRIRIGPLVLTWVHWNGLAIVFQKCISGFYKHGAVGIVWLRCLQEYFQFGGRHLAFLPLLSSIQFKLATRPCLSWEIIWIYSRSNCLAIVSASWHYREVVCALLGLYMTNPTWILHASRYQGSNMNE